MQTVSIGDTALTTVFRNVWVATLVIQAAIISETGPVYGTQDEILVLQQV